MPLFLEKNRNLEKIFTKIRNFFSSAFANNPRSIVLNRSMHELNDSYKNILALIPSLRKLLHASKNTGSVLLAATSQPRYPLSLCSIAATSLPRYPPSLCSVAATSRPCYLSLGCAPLQLPFPPRYPSFAMIPLQLHLHLASPHSLASLQPPLQLATSPWLCSVTITAISPPL